ncbi:outer membrane beta-barrel family protein [uncultured Dokdonia sp.]|uniref:outer membrane beta-barrel family protein n=1 Tax=uncultured Dokdonia sp. TaxID=575653 RepID=UPI002619240B|nr:outer membrane beta-barrel family protein [uncultured Dokdonia sp.]
MKNFTPILIVLLMLLNTSSLIAQQTSISGKVIAISGEPIPFVNIVLYDSEEIIVQGTITEDNGTFAFVSVSDGVYTVKASFVGYETFVSGAFTLSGNTTLPDIELTEVSESLDEVTVISKKPTISRKADRLVFNVENTIAAQGTTWDILKRTPGVVVKQGELSVRNKNATVYLNGRKVELSFEEIQSLLESIGGNVIKSLEVITNPSAKYDAEGGAILNIISSKALYLGYKGSITARGTYGIFPKHYFGTSHYFKNKKLNVFFNYGYSPLKKTTQNNSFVNYQNQNTPISNWLQDFERKTWTKAHNANLILDYQLNEKQKLSLSAVGLYSPNEFNFARSTTAITSFADTSFDIFTTSGLDSEQKNIALDLSYEYSLEKGNIQTNVHYTSYGRDRTQRLSSVYTDPEDAVFRNVRFNSEAIQDIEIYTGQLDYTSQLGGVDFEAGGKVATINSRSTINFLNIQNDTPNGLDQAQNDDFLYDETVFAGYFTLSKEIGKWSLKGGLRGEQTNSTGNSLVLSEIVELDYLEWFPSAYVQYELSENHSFSIDYGRKLYRPRYQDLNPFAYFLNENNFSRGNSALLPAFSNEFNLNYSLKGAYFFDVYYRDNGENILTLPFQDNTNQVLRTDRQNALDSKSWGLDFTHGRSIAKWWYFYTYMSIFHEEETFVAIESDNAIVTNDINGFYGSFSNFLTLNKDKAFTGEVSLAYTSRFLFGSYVQEATTDLTIGVKKTFWDKRASLSVTVNDALGEVNALLTSRYLNQNNGFIAVPETQNVQIGFTYNFGNFKLEDNNRTLDKKERERLRADD